MLSSQVCDFTSKIANFREFATNFINVVELCYQNVVKWRNTLYHSPRLFGFAVCVNNIDPKCYYFEAKKRVCGIIPMTSLELNLSKAVCFIGTR